MKMKMGRRFSRVGEQRICQVEGRGGGEEKGMSKRTTEKNEKKEKAERT